MNKISTSIYTIFNGTLVGTDEFGNRYFERKSFPIQIGRRNTKRRWVLYNGFPEPTKVPPYWHGWLHHTTDVVPTEEDAKKLHKWQKGHLANLTGTEEAYVQPGLDGDREKVSADYEAWNPNN
jgi:NADH:ubiquinone oxidoreductase subunit